MVGERSNEIKCRAKDAVKPDTEGRAARAAGALRGRQRCGGSVSVLLGGPRVDAVLLGVFMSWFVPARLRPRPRELVR
jgi:hypothetical protein